MEINNIAMQQMNFNPIQNYNKFLNGSASFDVNTDFQNDFDTMLQKEIKAESNMSAMQRKIGSSPVESLMSSIENAFGNGLNDVNEKRMQADALQEAFARGEDVSIHDLMIASEKSALSMQMAMQLRNKMISDYTDIKNMNF